MEIKRVFTAVIFLAITFTCIIGGGWSLFAFLAVIVFFGMKELLNLMNAKGLHPSRLVTYVMTSAFILTGLINEIEYLDLVTAVAVMSAFFAILFRKKEARIVDVGTTLLCIFYGGFLVTHFLFLRNLDMNRFNFFGLNTKTGLAYVLLMVICITTTDVMAYYIGKNFGKNKLCEEISPNKTIEGAVGAAICAVIAAIVVGYFIDLALWQSICAGIVVTLSAQFGDLVESMLKRDAGAKDSSNILPGHGGFLDRADSYIFTVATTYYFFYYFVVNPII